LAEEYNHRLDNVTRADYGSAQHKSDNSTDEDYLQGDRNLFADTLSGDTHIPSDQFTQE
jgi:hypothetical protein